MLLRFLLKYITHSSAPNPRWFIPPLLAAAPPPLRREHRSAKKQTLDLHIRHINQHTQTRSGILDLIFSVTLKSLIVMRIRYSANFLFLSPECTLKSAIVRRFICQVWARFIGKSDAGPYLIYIGANAPEKLWPTYINHLKCTGISGMEMRLPARLH